MASVGAEGRKQKDTKCRSRAVDGGANRFGRLSRLTWPEATSPVVLCKIARRRLTYLLANTHERSGLAQQHSTHQRAHSSATATTSNHPCTEAPISVATRVADVSAHHTEPKTV